MACSLAVAPAGGPRTWTVIDEGYRTVAPVEEWLEAHRHLWSPNTVRGYATSLAQWWTFLEQRGEAERWREVGIPAVSGFLSWLRNGRTVEHALVGAAGRAVSGDPGGSVGGVDLFLPVAGGRVRGAGRGAAAARGATPHTRPGACWPIWTRARAPSPSAMVRVRGHRSPRPAAAAAASGDPGRSSTAAPSRTRRPGMGGQPA